MAHPLHHGFGSVHLFLLSLVLCAHTRAVLCALLEKMGSAPNRPCKHETRQSTYFRSCTLELYETGKAYAKGRATIST